MQLLKVSGAVRPLKLSLGVKWLIGHKNMCIKCRKSNVNKANKQTKEHKCITCSKRIVYNHTV